MFVLKKLWSAVKILYITFVIVMFLVFLYNLYIGLVNEDREKILLNLLGLNAITSIATWRD